MSSRRQSRLVAGLAATIVITAGCRVQVGTEVDVRRDGGGSMTVTVTADDTVRDAFGRAGLADFGQALFGTSADRDLPQGSGGGDAFSDLRAAGWRVDAVGGGIRVVHDFAPGEDLEPILASLGGGDTTLSPIQALNVVHSGGFPRERVEASGRVGLSAEALARLAAQAGSGAPTAAEVEDVLGTTLTDLVTVGFHLDLPGSVGTVDADPAPAATDDLTWELPGGRTLDFGAASSYWSSLVIWTLTVLALAVVTAVVLVVWRRRVVVRRRRGAARSARPRPSSRGGDAGRSSQRRGEPAPAHRPPATRTRR